MKKALHRRPFSGVVKFGPQPPKVKLMPFTLTVTWLSHAPLP
jgi:hypothetical protein